MRIGRLLLLVALAGLLAGGALVDRDRDETAAAVEAAPIERALPSTRSQGPAATWYCPVLRAPTVGESGIAVDGSLVLSNPGPDEAEARLTVLSASAAPSDRRLVVPARGLLLLPASDLSDADLVAAVVETTATRLGVAREVTGEFGRDVAPCASTVASEWYFAVGSTRRDADLVLGLVNPFPDEAVVDIEVATEAEAGPFRNSNLEGIVVPGGRPTTVVMTDIARRRDQISIRVVTRTGRVVADRINTYDGSLDRIGLSLSLAVASPATDWSVVGGPREANERERLVVHNPNDETAQISVEVQAAEGFVEPYERSVAPHSFEVIVLDEADRGIPAGVAHGVIVSSLNDVPVVAEMERWGAQGPEPERILDTTGEEADGEGDQADAEAQAEAPPEEQETEFVPGPPGSDAWPGAAVLAEEWTVPLVRRDDASRPTVVIHNPAPEAVTATVMWFAGGRRVEVGRYEVAAASATSVDLSRVSASQFGLIVESTGPVSVAAGDGPAEWAPALPVDVHLGP